MPPAFDLAAHPITAADVEWLDAQLRLPASRRMAHVSRLARSSFSWWPLPCLLRYTVTTTAGGEALLQQTVEQLRAAGEHPDDAPVSALELLCGMLVASELVESHVMMLTQFVGLTAPLPEMLPPGWSAEAVAEDMARAVEHLATAPPAMAAYWAAAMAATANKTVMRLSGVEAEPAGVVAEPAGVAEDARPDPQSRPECCARGAGWSGTAYGV